MKLRTIYFKTTEMDRTTLFWQSFLLHEPTKQSPTWTEFKVGEVRLAILLNNFGDTYSGSRCVPVFEFPSEETLKASLSRAQELGAKIVLDSLTHPSMKSIVMKDVTENEFELTLYHD
jgi:hypothetical protein